jgi:hypothetical protein
VILGHSDGTTAAEHYVTLTPWAAAIGYRDERMLPPTA